MAQYALESTNQPIGISEYQLSKLMPENIQSQLPTIEDIEATLSDIKETKGIWKSWDQYDYFNHVVEMIIFDNQSLIDC